jgi:hypothetical protein
MEIGFAKERIIRDTTVSSDHFRVGDKKRVCESGSTRPGLDAANPGAGYAFASGPREAHDDAPRLRLPASADDRLPAFPGSNRLVATRAHEMFGLDPAY